MGLFHGPTRRAFRPVAAAFFRLKIVLPLVLFAFWVLGAVGLALQAGLWVPELWGDTVFWSFGGLIWFFGLAGATKDPNFFRRRLIDAVGLAAFMEFFAAIKPLPLAAEVILVVVAMVLGLLKGAAGSLPSGEQLARRIDQLLVIAGAALLAYVAIGLAQNWGEQDFHFLWRQLVLPIWLTLVATPFIYVMALWAAYEGLFLRLKFLNEMRRPRLTVSLGIVAALRGNLLDIGGIFGHDCRQASTATSFKVAFSAVQASKRKRAQEFLSRREARERLVRLAGVDGVDKSGRRLDRREFAATKSALEWLATCHMAWFHKRGRYRRDLLEFLGDFEQQGLRGDHGISLRVSRDGRRWFAYRQTATGWFFGIGAIGAPPSKWLYDGPVPPNGYPDPRAGWTDTAGAEPWPVEWLEEAAV